MQQGLSMLTVRCLFRTLYLMETEKGLKLNYQGLRKRIIVNQHDLEKAVLVLKGIKFI